MEKNYKLSLKIIPGIVNIFSDFVKKLMLHKITFRIDEKKFKKK